MHVYYLGSLITKDLQVKHISSACQFVPIFKQLLFTVVAALKEPNTHIITPEISYCLVWRSSSLLSSLLDLLLHFFTLQLV